MDSNVVPINREAVVPSGNLSIEKKSVYRYGKMEIICPDSQIVTLATRAMIFRIFNTIVGGFVICAIAHFVGPGKEILNLIQVLLEKG